jgi:hypothetical protein
VTELPASRSATQRIHVGNAWPIITFAAIVALTYGYETFSFHLTLDEELFGENVRNVSSWVAEGRWSMALLSLALPSAVVPVVSTGLGVVLSSIAWWGLSRRYLSMSPWQATFAASMAGTVPVLAFIFSFSTIAYGIGVGNLLLLAFLWGLSSRSWVHRGLGMFAGAAAIGIYDSFLVALAALSLVHLLNRVTTKEISLSALMLGGSLAVSRTLSEAVLAVSGVHRGAYVAQFVDFAGLIDHPKMRLSSALHSYGQTLWLSSERFGLHSPWLAISVGVLVLLGIAGIGTGPGTMLERGIQLGFVGCLILLPLGAEAISASPVQLRSMLYLPTILLIISAMGVRAIGRWRKKPAVVACAVVAAVVALAVLGNAVISNRLFASSEAAASLDQKLAFEIGQEKDRLSHTNSTTTVPILVSGKHEWPHTVFTPTREALGVSFFNWDGGATRVAYFLQTRGVMVSPAAFGTSAGWRELNSMPTYPQPGWVEYDNGMLLVKFGDRTQDQ